MAEPVPFLQGPSLTRGPAIISTHGQVPIWLNWDALTHFSPQALSRNPLSDLGITTVSRIKIGIGHEHVYKCGTFLHSFPTHRRAGQNMPPVMDLKWNIRRSSYRRLPLSLLFLIPMFPSGCLTDVLFASGKRGSAGESVGKVDACSCGNPTVTFYRK